MACASTLYDDWRACFRIRALESARTCRLSKTLASLRRGHLHVDSALPSQSNSASSPDERLSMLQLGLEKRLHDRVALLSGGQRQALALIMATLGSTKVLLLDEHTAALDPAAAELVMNLTREIVKKFGITTVMVTHNMRQALELGSRTIMLHQGQIILDITGAERASINVEQLVKMFRRKEGAEISDDHLLLA